MRATDFTDSHRSESCYLRNLRRRSLIATQKIDARKVTSAPFHACSNRARTLRASLVFPWSRRLCQSPNSAQPFSRNSNRSLRYTFSASRGRRDFSRAFQGRDVSTDPNREARRNSEYLECGRLIQTQRLPPRISFGPSRFRLRARARRVAARASPDLRERENFY